MRDYAELVKALRACQLNDCCRCRYYNLNGCFGKLLQDSAEAIKELLLENDALGTNLCECDDLLKKLEVTNDSN